MSQEPKTERFDLPADCDPKIVEAVEYWQSIKPAEGLPGRQHFDPTDIPHLLRGVWLIDVEQEPLRFAFRLVGTSVVSYFGSDPTGHRLDDVFANFEETIAYRDLKSVVETRQPSWRRGVPLLSRPEKATRLERVYLPFARNGKDVDLIFCVSVFDGSLH